MCFSPFYNQVSIELCLMKIDLLKPTADIVLKLIFGQEKEITIEFINLFVNPPHPDVDIIYLTHGLTEAVNQY